MLKITDDRHHARRAVLSGDGKKADIEVADHFVVQLLRFDGVTIELVLARATLAGAVFGPLTQVFLTAEQVSAIRDSNEFNDFIDLIETHAATSSDVPCVKV